MNILVNRATGWIRTMALTLTLALSSCTCLGLDDDGSLDDLFLDRILSGTTNQVAPDRMLLVLSAPSVNNSYYAPAFKSIVAFQIAYARAVMGNDNIVVVVDAATRPYYAGLPSDILLTDEIPDIWMRDFTTVNPVQPRQFKYTSASMTPAQSVEVQAGFRAFADYYGIIRDTTPLKIDGGNIVDDYAGNIITTTRFMTDNGLTRTQAKQNLKTLLGASRVAILDPDEPALAHSDGMVMWLDEKNLLVNDYSTIDGTLRTSVLNELKTSFPNTNVIEVPVQYATNPPGQWVGFSSACGVNLNSAVTYKNIYVPTFNMSHDSAALGIIRGNTNKKVIAIDARGVCPMGGSVRCLTWQLTGKNAEKLILAARLD